MVEPTKKESKRRKGNNAAKEEINRNGEDQNERPVATAVRRRRLHTQKEAIKSNLNTAATPAEQTDEMNAEADRSLRQSALHFLHKHLSSQPDPVGDAVNKKSKQYIERYLHGPNIGAQWCNSNSPLAPLYNLVQKCAQRNAQRNPMTARAIPRTQLWKLDAQEDHVPLSSSSELDRSAGKKLICHEK